VRHVDDSVARVMLGREMVLRRARGYAPLQLPGVRFSAQPVLAVGAHLKNTVALTAGPNVIVSQHIGDLETEPAFEAFRHVTSDLQILFESRPNLIAHDAHPDYASTRFAKRPGRSTLAPAPSPSLSPQGGEGLRVRGGAANTRSIAKTYAVQHHYAHVLSCMAENELKSPVLGVAWD